MNAIDHRQGTEKKMSVWKAKMYDLIRKVERPWIIKKEENFFSTFRTGTCPSVKCPLVSNTSITSAQMRWASQTKNIDNGFVDMRSKYVLRTRPSWTGVYGKEPWPRERKIWEKVLKTTGDMPLERG